MTTIISISSWHYQLLEFVDPDSPRPATRCAYWGEVFVTVLTLAVVLAACGWLPFSVVFTALLWATGGFGAALPPLLQAAVATTMGLLAVVVGVAFLLVIAVAATRLAGLLRRGSCDFVEYK